MGRHIVSLCLAGLLVGFALLLTSLGMTGIGANQPPAPASMPVEMLADGELLPVPEKPETDCSDDICVFTSLPWVFSQKPPDIYGKPTGPDFIPEPAYPFECREIATGNAGSAPEIVTLEITVDANGFILRTNIVSSTNACFHETVLQAISRARFQPTGETRTVRKIFTFQQ